MGALFVTRIRGHGSLRYEFFCFFVFFFRSILPPELAEFFRIMSIFGRKRVSLKWDSIWSRFISNYLNELLEL